MELIEQTRDSRGIYLPHYIEPVSHIAIDVSDLDRVLSCLPASETHGGGLAR